MTKNLLADYFTLEKTARAEIIHASALMMKVDPIIIEKDLWVVLALRALFDQNQEHNTHKALTFKGGTSLSKAYQAIERFSEDIDITIDRKYLGLQITDEELKTFSRKQRDKTLQELATQGHAFIKSLQPFLESTLSSLISHGNITINFSQSDPLSLEIFYPSCIESSYNSYIKHRIYIEFGVRGDSYPTETRTVRSYLHETIKQLNDVLVSVNVLLPIRTFFEKVTLLHAQAHTEDTYERLSRHYYDLHQLVQKGYLKEAITQLELLQSVISHKSLFFASKKASYETISTHGLKLLPSEHKLHELQKDYQAMELMIFGKHPSFEAIMNSIQEIEATLNQCLQAVKQ